MRAAPLYQSCYCSTVQYSTVKMLQTVNLLPWSCSGDYTVDQCSKPLLSCLDLFACSMEKFNNLAVFIQGSRLYGRLNFANSIFLISVVFGQRQRRRITFETNSICAAAILGVFFFQLVFFWRKLRSNSFITC